MRTTFRLVTAIMLALFAASCSDNTLLLPEQGDNNGKEDGIQLNDPVTLNLTIRKIGGDPVIYTRGEGDEYGIATENEREIKHFDVYLFKQDREEESGNKLDTYSLELKIVKSDGYTHSDPSAENPQPTFIPVDQADGFTFSISVEGTDARKLYFVANDTPGDNALESLVQLTTGDREATFLEALTNLVKDNAAAALPLLMTKSVEIPEATMITGAASAEGVVLGDIILERVAARIDIENLERSLTIDKVQLRNTPNLSYIFPAETAYAEEELELINMAEKTIDDALRIAPTEETPVDPEEPDGEKTGGSIRLGSLFYPFEGIASEASHPVLRVWGRLGATAPDEAGNASTGGSEVVYDIPLRTTSEKINRNTRYTIRINNAMEGLLSFSFTVADWEHDDELDVIHDQISASSVRVTYEGAVIEKNTLIIPAAEITGQNLRLDVSSNTKWKVEITSTGGIGTVSEPQVLTEGAWGNETAGDIGQAFFFTIGTNASTDSRTIAIKVTSLADSNKSYSFRIVQEGTGG